MHNSHLYGKIQTVLGPIEPDTLGVTLPHEHVVCDGSAWFVEPAAANEKAMAHQPVSLENLWWIRYHWFQNMDDILLLEEGEAVEEAKRFEISGGQSIVEMSNNGLGRDPEALVRISRATGLHVLMGSGYYLAASLPQNFDEKSEAEITDEIVRDITEGVGNTGIRSGFIGEIGSSWPLDPRRLSGHELCL